MKTVAAPAQPPPPQGPAREDAYDLLKGVGILAVVALHVTGRAASKFSLPDDGLWWTLNVLNLLVNFGVPLFLLVSAIVWTQSAVRRNDWKRFYASRAKGVVLPYLVWSAIYAFVHHAQSHSWTIGLTEIKNDLIWGKASFHLYFLSVLIQFGLLLPVLIWLVRRIGGGFLATLTCAVLIQAAVFELQHVWIKCAFPASLAVWYLVVLIPGVWIGLSQESWRACWGRYALPLCLASLVGTAGWLMISIERLQKHKIESMQYNWLNVAYYATICLALAGFAVGWARCDGRAVGWLIAVGRASLQIYLLHLLVLDFLSLHRIVSVLALAQPAAPLALYALTFGLTFAIALGITRLGLDPYLFGKSKPG